MSVIAFVGSTSWNRSVIEHAAWAAKSLDQPVLIVAQEENVDTEPAIAFDAYGGMDAREDLFRELTSRERSDMPTRDAAALDNVQSAARIARELGVAKVRTTTTQDDPATFIEQSTDSGDLLVLPRRDVTDSGARQWMDQYLRARRRMMLLVPDSFSQPKSWFIAIDGKAASGRAVDYLTSKKLLKDVPGTAAFVGNDYQSRLHFRDAVKHLHSAGHQLESHELQGSADDVLAAVLTILPTDLLIMGAYGQGRFRSLIEGSTTSRLLSTFRGPVLIARD